MSKLITKELNLSSKYMLDTETNDFGVEIVKLTKDNVARVEANIKNDSSYRNSSDINKGPENGYGSSSHWITKLRPCLMENKHIDDLEYKNIMCEVVSAIDRENSTHLNADKCGRKELTERIVNEINKSDLLNYLKFPKDNDYKIINILQKETSSGRNNFSFATKFCHYMCFYLFEDECRDNFSIYDNVLVKALPKYMDRFNILKKDFGEYKKNYKNYIRIIDEIIARSNEETNELISRNGFDHLLWYFHKGR